MSWPASLPMFVNGPLAAADLQSLSNGMQEIGDSWSTFTTSLVSDTGTNPNLGTGGTAQGWAMVAGKLVHFRILVTWGTGLVVGSGNYCLTLPGSSPTFMCALNSTLHIRQASGGNNYYGAAHVYSSPGNLARLLSGTGANPFVTGTAPVAWASGDTISLAGSMEVS